MGKTVPGVSGGPAGEDVVIGIDLGATGTRVVARVAGTTVNQAQIATTDLGRGDITERVARFVELARRMVPDGMRLAGMGIGASGPVELPSGIIRNPDTLAPFSGFDLGAAIGSDLGAPVVVDNDAVTAALGEHRFGAGQGCDRLLVVTLGTGIGACFLQQGRPFRDGDGQHPECGHIPVLPGGPPCYCGLVGCWEMVANRQSLQARVRQVLPGADLGQAERLLALGPHGALAGALGDYGHSLGRGLVALIIAYAPRRVVVCGSVSRFLPYFSPGVQAELERAEGYRSNVQVVESALGDMAGAVGASVLVGRDAGPGRAQSDTVTFSP